MKKKGILLSEPVNTKKTGEIITAQIVNEILVLNCFKDKKMIARYCMSKDNYQYEALVDDKWVKKKLYNLFGYGYWGSYDAKNKIKFDSVEDEEVIDTFFGKQRYRNRLDEIDTMESQYIREKSETAYERKTKRIEELMDKVPALPDNFENWSSRVMFGGEEYLFYDKGKDQYFCTACGKWHTVKELKHNQKWSCSRANREVIVKRRQQSVTKRERCMVVQIMDTTRSVARHFTVEKVWNMEGSTFNPYEDVRYILSRDGSKRVQWYYGQHTEADEFYQDWWDTNPRGKHCYIEYCYPNTCKEALKNTAYENMSIQLMAEKGWKIQYNKIMANYSNCGFMEYMVKGNFERLTREISEDFSCWGGYYGTLGIHEARVQDIFKIDMQRVNRLRHKNGGKKYLKWLQWEQENRSLPEDTIQWFEDNNIWPDDIKFIMDRMSPVQIANYLKRQKDESNKSVSYILEIWQDYISMAKRMKMDIRDEIVFRTKNLLQRHDELVDLINQKEADKAAAEMLKKFPKINKICKEIHEKYRYANDNFIISVPRGTKDIMAEGRALHHCVATSERYFERINSRETFILFLRKTDRPLNPYYTLEIEPDGTVRQKRSEYNRQPELSEIESFIKEWQKVVKNRLDEEDKKIAGESRKKRISEMQELKVKNTTLADTLTEDLMEAI